MACSCAAGNVREDDDEPGRGRTVGRGFGLGISAVLATDKNDGASGGWWQTDPSDGSMLIFLAHSLVDLAQMSKGIGLGVWAAIETFQTLASVPQA